MDSLSERYSEFRDSDGQVILDVDEERQLRQRLVEQGVMEPWEELGGAAAKGRESRQVEEDIELEGESSKNTVIRAFDAEISTSILQLVSAECSRWRSWCRCCGRRTAATW